jgi:putative cardiolipin synthase
MSVSPPQVRCCRAVWIVLALVFSGCATTLPTDKPPSDVAQPPRAEGRLASVEQPIAALHGAEASGFKLLERNADGLIWRVALIDSAQYAIDLQYYVWFGDVSGQLLLSRVIAAAERGVKVRILFDDLSTMLRRMSSLELRDELLARIDRHPRIEVRVFNGWHARDWAGRVVEGAIEFERLNRRMHNKQMIVDNRVSIIGGRNIGDEYMGLDTEFNFHDLDVLGVGPVARQGSAVFDRYWNSDWVRRLPAYTGSAKGRLTPEMIELPPEAETEARLAMKALLSDAGRRARDIDRLPDSLSIGRSTVHTDPPSRATSSRNHMPEAFRALMRSARREVLITNAYIIPDEVFIRDLRELTARGVRVRILTNSLESHDVPAVNAHYEAWRGPILDAGATLHELRADAAIQAELVDTPPVRSGFVGLHTKAMVIDRERSFIGSMNLDPRSEVFNSEMGVIIDSAALSETLSNRMERDMGGANSWFVTRDADGGLRWTSAAGERTRQPARSVWQRVQNIVFKLVPATYY